MNYKEFVEEKKSLLIAPAGYGKTFTIAKAIEHTLGKQLVLTHTHAGIASIREKLKKNNIGSSRYSIETISSFSQKITHAFYIGNDIPEQDTDQYHSFVLDRATIILSSSTVRKIIAKTFSGLFVDEYQDCTVKQHNLILRLVDILPTRILGDPLQGIFDFDGSNINLDTDLSEFRRFPELPTPFRWYKDENNKKLGDKLKEIRQSLLAKQNIPLIPDNKNKFHIISVKENEFNKKDSEYRRTLTKIIRNTKKNPDLESLLILVPMYEAVNSEGKRVPKGSINDRARIREKIDFSKSLILLESIDDKLFYSVAREVDKLLLGINKAQKKTDLIKGILLKLFNITEINNWFGKNSLKQKRNLIDKENSAIVLSAMNAFFNQPTYANFFSLLVLSKDKFNLKFKRDEVLRSLLSSLKKASNENISAYEAMKVNRNHIRRVGRKIHGKCIGTTLLTKGLEFDTVVILDAHKFSCRKNLYVALTRCCKRLIIFTSQNELSPY